MGYDAVMNARRTCNAIMAALVVLDSDPEYSRLTSMLLGVFGDLQKTIREAERVH